MKHRLLILPLEASKNVTEICIIFYTFVQMSKVLVIENVPFLMNANPYSTPVQYGGIGWH